MLGCIRCRSYSRSWLKWPRDLSTATVPRPRYVRRCAAGLVSVDSDVSCSECCEDGWWSSEDDVLLYHYLKYAIVIGPTRVTWYGYTITIAQCINIPGQHSCSRGQQYRAILPGNITRERDAILGRSNLYSALHLLISQALTSLSFRR